MQLEAEVIQYLETPLTEVELDGLCQELQVAPQELLRTKEARFRELRLSVVDMRTRDEWLQLMTENPILIERPIVRVGSQCIIGRPMEKVQALFESVRR